MAPKSFLMLTCHGSLPARLPPHASWCWPATALCRHVILCMLRNADLARLSAGASSSAQLRDADRPQLSAGASSSAQLHDAGLPRLSAGPSYPAHFRLCTRVPLSFQHIHSSLSERGRVCLSSNAEGTKPNWWISNSYSRNQLWET